jgi:hypothetical protein
MTKLEFLQDQLDHQRVAIKELRREIAELKYGRGSKEYAHADQIYKESLTTI